MEKAAWEKLPAEQLNHLISRQMLNGENAVHTFNAEAALTIEEVGNVSLLEASLLSQTETGKIAFLDTLPKCVAQIFLKHPELHEWKCITIMYSLRLTAV